MSQRFPMTFSLNEVEYTDLYIVSYRIKLEVLDGKATGRSKAYGWPMIRDPQGVITNLNLEFASPTSENPHLKHLWETCKSMGKKEFARVRFVDPLGSVLEQEMYCVAAELTYKRIERDGKVLVDPLSVSFIAREGV